MPERLHLTSQKIGRTVIVFDRTDSTNTRAFEEAGRSAEHGTIVLAKEQTSGRGQHGRRWLARPDSSVLMSVLLYPPIELNRPVILTAWAAISVCSLVRQLTSQQPRIKWPNDVLVQGKKICGILIEQSRQGSVPLTIVGIGLNVNQTAEELQALDLPLATSLHLTGSADTTAHSVARALIDALDQEYVRLSSGDITSLEQCWAEHLQLENQPVELECQGKLYHGELITCSFAQILVRQSNGITIGFAPEFIQQIKSC